MLSFHFGMIALLLLTCRLAGKTGAIHKTLKYNQIKNRIPGRSNEVVAAISEVSEIAG